TTPEDSLISYGDNSVLPQQVLQFRRRRRIQEQPSGQRGVRRTLDISELRFQGSKCPFDAFSSRFNANNGSSYTAVPPVSKGLRNRHHGVSESSPRQIRRRRTTQGIAATARRPLVRHAAKMLCHHAHDPIQRRTRPQAFHLGNLPIGWAVAQQASHAHCERLGAHHEAAQGVPPRRAGRFGNARLNESAIACPCLGSRAAKLAQGTIVGNPTQGRPSSAVAPVTAPPPLFGLSTNLARTGFRWI